jgi:hypothetical protein
MRGSHCSIFVLRVNRLSWLCRRALRCSRRFLFASTEPLFQIAMDAISLMSLDSAASLIP